MFAVANPNEVPIAAELKILVLVVPILAQCIKQIPPIKAREDWLMPLIVLGLSMGLACASLGKFAPLDGLFLGVAALGAFNVAHIPAKIKNSNTPPEG